MLLDASDEAARLALAKRFTAATLHGEAKAAAVAAARLLEAKPGEDFASELGRLTDVALSDPPAPAPTIGDAAAVADFLGRSADEADELAALALAWDHGEATAKDELRRRLHTLKGDAGILGLHDLQSLAHRIEDLVQTASAAPVQQLLAACAWVGREIGHLAGGPAPGPLPNLETQAAEAASTAARVPSESYSKPATSLRVEVERVDALADAVGELGIAHAMLANILGRTDRRTAGLLARIDRLLRTAQDASGRLRMVPVRPVFQRAERAARELAGRLGRPVGVRLIGADSELDKAVAESLGDPLLHVVRNALDHGIEQPEARAAAGKPPTATLTISAERREGRVVIAIEDDGCGLDRARILACARQRGLPTPDDDAPDAAVWELLCLPGFSTSSVVTEISGRGVGLDVVRATVHRLRGRIDISSRLGQGTRFALVLPPTLVAVDGLGLLAGGQRFVIPTSSVHACLRPRPGELDSVAGQGQVIPHQGRLLPWRPLPDLLGLEPLTSKRPLAVVVDDGVRRAAIAVDAILGRTQAVLKPLAGLPELPGVIGTAIGADGRIDLVLDPVGLLSTADDPVVRKAS